MLHDTSHHFVLFPSGTAAGLQRPFHCPNTAVCTLFLLEENSWRSNVIILKWFVLLFCGCLPSQAVVPDEKCMWDLVNAFLAWLKRSQQVPNDTCRQGSFCEVCALWIKLRGELNSYRFLCTWSKRWVLMLSSTSLAIGFPDLSELRFTAWKPTSVGLYLTASIGPEEMHNLATSKSIDV